jgi:hypothetical protein
MKMRKVQLKALLIVGILVVAAIVAATATVAFALSSGAPGCAKFAALKGAFPKASAVGFTARQPVSRAASLRNPVWPGTCAKWFTAYRRGSARVEVRLTLFKTHKQALVALAEPAYGPVERLSNGALVRKYRGAASVDGVMKQYGGVASVYRNVFIGSVSIADKAIPLPAQIRLHRHIYAGVLRLG